MDTKTDVMSVEDLLLEYVGLKAQVRALQHQIKAIHPDVLEALKDSAKKHEVGGAIVSVRQRKIYKYSDQVNWITEEIYERKQALKDRKQDEIDKGIAEVESIKESVYVHFTKA